MKSLKATKLLSLRRTGFIAIFLLLSAIVFLSGAGRFGSARTLETPNLNSAHGLRQPATPLESLLNEDGTLNLDAGFSGSVDPTGWQMVADPGEKPRFARAGEQPDAKHPPAPSAQSPMAPGDENWDPTFGLPGVSSPVYAIAISGSTVYVGGAFTTAGGVSANYIAGWDGSNWFALDNGMNNGVNNLVRAIAISGSDVYVGGDFTTAGGGSANFIARWNTAGSQWFTLGGGTGGTFFPSSVYAIAISGSNVYVGGYFTTAGVENANYIARWDGANWHSLPDGGGPSNGTNNTVRAIAISGSNVYVGGDFTTAGGGSANYIARWDGANWHSLPDGGGPSNGTNNTVRAIAISGSNVYVGGDFTTASGGSANYIARWNGSSWSPLTSGTSGPVYAIAISGSDVYVGGNFTVAGGGSANYIARWSGSQWFTLNIGTNGLVRAIATSGIGVYAGGDFTTAGGVGASYIARWDGSNWVALGSGNGMNGFAHAIATGGGNVNVYVGGDFTTAGGCSPCNRVAGWDGSNWSPLGSGTNGPVHAIAISGSDVYVGGDFTTVGGGSANYIARWNGSNWSPLGSGTNGPVYAIAITGSNVYVGGGFTTAGGGSANYFARWNGSSWSPLSSGTNGPIYAIAITGGNVYVGGGFTVAGGGSANYIARWDGAGWHSLPDGGGPNNGTNNTVRAIAISGSNVYVGGDFTTAGGGSANYIAGWNTVGSQWSTLSSGTNGSVYAIAISGSDVYAGGFFAAAGGAGANFIARWNTVRSQWFALNSGVNNTVSAIAIGSSDVYAGGQFTVAGNKPSYYFGIWHNPAQPILVGHVFWQGLPAQPNPLQQMPVTLTLKMGTTEVNYPIQLTDASGFFTVPVGSLPSGNYAWRVNGPTYLANSGTVNLSAEYRVTSNEYGVSKGVTRKLDTRYSVLVTQVEMGLMKTGDLAGDNVVNVPDFNLFKSNFGLPEAPPIEPGGP